ncbi:MAG: hypothetical protein JWQ43_3660 [Glaciihabitans sp.]|nr:hypothetical protein [Glaciihabitans sp.]
MDNGKLNPDEVTAWFEHPLEERVLDTLGHVMTNLRDLPAFACNRSVLNRGSIWFPAYLACVDAFFVNARLAAEFFVKMPSRDFNAHMFVPTWSPPPGIAKRLDRVWWMTSKHIVHIGRERVPRSPEEWQQENMSYRALMRINRDAYGAFKSFVEANAVDGSPHHAMLHGMLSGVRPFSVREASTLHGKDRKAERRATRYLFPDPYASVWWG